MIILKTARTLLNVPSHRKQWLGCFICLNYLNQYVWSSQGDNNNLKPKQTNIHEIFGIPNTLHSLRNRSILEGFALEIWYVSSIYKIYVSSYNVTFSEKKKRFQLGMLIGVVRWKVKHVRDAMKWREVIRWVYQNVHDVYIRYVRL